MTRPTSPFPRGLLLVVVAAALLSRGSSLGNGFVNYDDDAVRREAATTSLVDAWTGTFYYAYKPVYATSLWIDERLFGDDARGWHVGNVALLAVAAALVALLVHGLFRSAFLGAAAGLLLATHPVHTESVAWVAERKDVLSLVLVLLAHLSWRRTRARLPAGVPLLALVLLALGGLAKGTVWTYAGVIALDEALFGAREGRAARLVALAALALLGIGLDAWVGAAYGPGAVHHDSTTLGLVAAMAGVHARYVASLVWPLHLSVDYPVDPAGSFRDAWAIAGLGLAVAAVVGLVLGLRRRRPLLALACGLWILGLAPVNNVWPTTSILRADRYLLLPALGAYLLAGAALLRLRGAAPAALAVVAVALGIGSWSRGKVWEDSEALWSDAVEKEPASALGWINRAEARQHGSAWVGVEADASRGIEASRALRREELVVRGRLLRSLALLSLGRVEEARAEANEAVRSAVGLSRSPFVHDPAATLASAHARVGQVLTERSRTASDPAAAAADQALALASFRRGVEADPESFEAQVGLGNLLAATAGKKGLAEAANALRHADRILPGDLSVAVPLVTVLYDLGLDAEAKAVFARAIERNGEHRDLLLLRARLREEGEGNAEGAAADYERVLARNPADDEARRRLSALRRRQGTEALAEARRSHDPALLRKALEAFDRALAADPRDPESQWLAGDVLLADGKFHDARERYRKAALGLPPGAEWVKTLEARAGVLEAIALSHAGLPDDAARVLSAVVRLSPPRIDIGATLLEGEIAWLVPAAEAIEGGSAAEVPLASAVLRGAAALVVGDDAGALATLSKGTGALGSSPPRGSRLEGLYDVAYLLRALSKAGRADVAGARADLELVRPHREGDPLVAYHLLLLDRAEATARLAIARGSGEGGAEEGARAALAETRRRAESLAERDPPWPGPGLLAAEMEIEAQDFLGALRRLAAMEGRFPGSAAVRRGEAAVFEAQALAGGDRTLLFPEAERSLLRAKDLDPRDPRTSLDLSQLYRLEGDLDAARRFALSAASVETTPGPASKALGAILVELGRRALAAKDFKRASGLAEAARAADPAAAAPEILEGDLEGVTDVESKSGAPNLDKALRAYRLAREKEPGSRAATAALAACHRRRGGQYLVWRVKRPKPAAKDGVPPAPAEVKRWETEEAEFRRVATADLEAALRLEPEGPEADIARRELEQFRRLDPEDEHQRALAAQKAYLDGESLRKAGKPLEALDRYREAVRAFSDDLRAWMRIAEVSVMLLPGAEHEVEGLAAIESVRDLDAEGQYPEPDLYAGMIWAARAAAGTEGASDRAKRALERFLERTTGLPAQAENRARAQGLLDRLAKGR